jgi:hypothetical protein
LDLEYLKRKMVDQSQFADYPELYSAKDHFSTWADAALMIGYGSIWDVLYMVPEYQRLRNTPIRLQWMRVSGQENQYYVSLYIPEGQFKHIIQRGLRELKNLKICHEKKPVAQKGQKEKA